MIDCDEDLEDVWFAKGTIIVDAQGATVGITVTQDDAIRVAATPKLFAACAAMVDAVDSHTSMTSAIKMCRDALRDAERLADELAQASRPNSG